MSRAVVLMPNGLTLINLFCGIYAIVLATRGDFASAPTLIVLGGIADALDGRVARATGTGSRFGEELDSLVDAISFGFAPALIVYLGLPSRGNLQWLLVFLFTACAVMRLARFNVEQAGRKKTYFHGLPSPAAGLTLATYYWFSQTPLYNQTVILFTSSKTISDLPWHIIMQWLMAVLAALMISDVPYPAVPSIGFRSIRRLLGTVVVVGSVVLLLVRREEFIFPALLAYVAYGALKWVILGFLGRSSTPDEIFWEEEPPEAPPIREERVREHRRPPSSRVAAASTTTTTTVAPIETRREERGERGERSDRGERPERRDDGGVRRRRRRRGKGGTRPPGTNPPGASGGGASSPPSSPPSDRSSGSSE